MNKQFEFNVYVPAHNKIYKCSSIGWNEGYNCMEVLVNNSEWNFNEWFFNAEKGIFSDIEPTFSYTEKIDNIKILQCTGLYDCNKNYLYDGDKIEDLYGNIGAIIYCCGRFKIKWLFIKNATKISNEYNKISSSLTTRKLTKIKKIGNIYEALEVAN